MLCIKRKRNLTVTRSRGHASAAAEAIKRRALTVARPREDAAGTRLGRGALLGRWKVETQTLTPIDLW